MQSSKQWNEYKWPLSLSVGITGLVWILLFAVVMLDPSKRLPMGIGHQMPGSASQNVTVRLLHLWSLLRSGLTHHASNVLPLSHDSRGLLGSCASSLIVERPRVSTAGVQVLFLVAAGRADVRRST